MRHKIVAGRDDIMGEITNKFHSGKYKLFFGKSPPLLDFKPSKYFNEKDKNFVLYIQKNEGLLLKKEWFELFEKNKNNSLAKIVILRSKYCPIELVDEIRIKELRKKSPDTNVLLESLRHPEKDVSKLMNIIKKIGEDELIDIFIKAFNKKEMPPIEESNLFLIQNNCPPNSFNGAHFLYSISSPIIEELKKEETNLNEETITNIANCMTLNDFTRNQFFNKGCRIEKIELPTPYMKKEIYRSMAEAVFDVDENDHNAYCAAINTHTILCSMIIKNQLSEECQIDLAERILHCKNMDTIANNLTKYLSTYATSPKSLTLLYSISDEVFKNPHFPKKLIDDKENQITEYILSQNQNDAIITYQKYINYFPFKKEHEEKIIKHTKAYGLPACYINTSIELLEGLTKQNLTPLTKLIIHLNKELRKENINQEAIKAILKSLPLCLDITIKRKNGDMCITSDEYQKIIKTIDNFPKKEDSITPINSLKKMLKNAYLSRDLSIDFPELFDFHKNFEPTIKTNITQEEVTNLFKESNTEAVTREIFKTYKRLNMINDKIELYQIIDNYVRLNDMLENEYGKKVKEFNQEKDNDLSH